MTKPGSGKKKQGENVEKFVRGYNGGDDVRLGKKTRGGGRQIKSEVSKTKQTVSKLRRGREAGKGVKNTREKSRGENDIETLHDQFEKFVEGTDLAGRNSGLSNTGKKPRRRGSSWVKHQEALRPQNENAH